ncbi:MAG TPA: hypothetical protein VF614_08860 [Chthoniobacteraceae bacterium]|jgi:hypothetical protein
MTSDPYTELAAALRERLEVIADREAYARDSAAHLARLQEVSGRVESLEQQLPPPVDRQLAHFLERRSYDKALAFLEQRTS